VTRLILSTENRLDGREENAFQEKDEENEYQNV
jgi:hypothetical protein